MGIQIFCPDETTPIPRLAVLGLSCDGCTENLFPVAQRFEQDGFIAQHTAAMAAGWLETFDKRGRIFLGPCCSRKQSRWP